MPCRDGDEHDKRKVRRGEEQSGLLRVQTLNSEL
jgi:hypothetical protein